MITGAGSGIGRHTAIQLGKDGFRVVLAGRRIGPLEETAALISEAGGMALPVSADVREPDSVTQLFSKTREAFGRLDVLFNNAGISAMSSLLEDLSFEEWQDCLAINVTGTFLCTQAAFRLMKDQDPMGGRIINNGSISAHVPRPNSIAYTASKHAVTGMTKTTLLDGRRYNIACSQIDIGNAGTDMTTDMSQGVPQADGSLAKEPTIDVNNIARAISYMAGLPLDANVPFMTVMATKMPYIGRG